MIKDLSRHSVSVKIDGHRRAIMWADLAGDKREEVIKAALDDHPIYSRSIMNDIGRLQRLQRRQDEGEDVQADIDTLSKEIEDAISANERQLAKQKEKEQQKEEKERKKQALKNLATSIEVDKAIRSLIDTEKIKRAKGKVESGEISTESQLRSHLE